MAPSSATFSQRYHAMLNETDLEELYDLIDKKKAEQKKEPNHLVGKQLQILEHFLMLEKMLKGMYYK